MITSALLVSGVVTGVAVVAQGRDQGYRRIAILPLGDSITFGSTGATGQSPGGYRGVLGDRLTAEGVPHSFVGTTSANPPLLDGDVDGQVDGYRHDGWPGSRVEELDAALTGPSRLGGGGWLTDPGRPLQPDVVVLLAGTNDVGQHYDPEHRFLGGYSAQDPSEMARFVDDLMGRLEHLVDTLRAQLPHASLVLCTIPPMRDRTAAAYNDAIRALVPQLADDGLRVRLADVEAALTRDRGDPDLIGPDHIHPTPAGYTRVAAAIAPAVVSLARR